MASPAPTIPEPIVVAHLSINGKDVPVVISHPAVLEGKSIEEVLAWPTLALQISKLQQDPKWDIEKLQIKGIKLFGPVNIGFVFLDWTAKYEGLVKPGACFLRPDAVAVLLEVTIEGEEQDERYIVLKEEVRMAACGPVLEVPAGIINAEGTFAGQAAKELKEETGIEIPAGQMVDLGKVHMSIGGCPEMVVLKLARITVTRKWMTAHHDKEHGVAEENERTKCKFIPVKDMLTRRADGTFLCEDAKFWAAWSRRLTV